MRQGQGMEVADSLPQSAAFLSLETSSLWLVVVLFLTRRFVPSHGHTLLDDSHGNEMGQDDVKE